MPCQEELSLQCRAWTGQQGAGRIQPSWVPLECLFCANLAFRNWRGPGGEGAEYLLVWGQLGLNPVFKCCSSPTCPAASSWAGSFPSALTSAPIPATQPVGEGVDELMSGQEGRALENGSSQPLLQHWRCFQGPEQTHTSGQPRAP